MFVFMAITDEEAKELEVRRGDSAEILWVILSVSDQQERVGN